MLSEAVEDYLKAIYHIEKDEGIAETTQLAQRLNVTPASATGMIRKLAEMRLVKHEPYQGVVLSATGTKVALELIRHHRLIELYLNEIMGVPWDKVHHEAEKLEHAISEELEDRMDELLGYPTIDPHGAPIPSKTGKIPRRVAERLADLKCGETAEIAEVSDEESELLRYVGELGLFPGASVRVVDIAPYRGPLTLKLKQKEVVVGRKAAEMILVRRAQGC